MLNFALAAALFCIVLWVTLADLRTVRTFRRDSSRYPMFAARDALVALVADGLMKEDDEVWKRAYLATNRLLHLDTRGDMLDFLEKRLLHEELMRNDQRARRKYELFLRKLRRAVDETPEFGAFLTQFGRGVNCMIMERTTVLTWTSLFCVHGLAEFWRMVQRWKSSFGRPAEQESAMESVVVAAAMAA